MLQSRGRIGELFIDDRLGLVVIQEDVVADCSLCLSPAPL
ncbi:hypothetical protein FHT70_005948 [Rhizobium sp. BK049]|nr:hypothetical protein [Rhizobium sp. BK049]